MFVSLLLAWACTGEVPPKDEVEPGEDRDDTGADDAENLPGDTADTGDDEAAEDAENERLYQELFDLGSVKEVRIELGPEGRAALAIDPRTYVEGAATVQGTRIEHVGVRLKGSGSFRPLDEKASLKLRFDKFVDGQKYATLKRLTLNNMVDDPAQAREVVAYHLWNEAGMNAPRAAFARVWIDDEDYGLYTLLEPMDSEWLERRYEQDEGNLYEANDSANLTPEGISHFELQTGPGGTELEDAAMVLATATTDYYEAAATVVDLEQFMDYYAWMNMVGSVDGYPFGLNDFFLYADPADGLRFDISPWGMDEAWNPAWVLQWGWSSTVPHRCLADAACRDMAQAHFDEALAVFEAAGVPDLAQELYALTSDVVMVDPRRPYTPAQVDMARVELLDMLTQWGDVVRRGWWIEPLPEPGDTGDTGDAGPPDTGATDPTDTGA